MKYFILLCNLQSEQLTTSAFKTDWPDCDKEYKKDLLLFMIRSQRPLELYAGGYFPLSLQTFMAVILSYYYFLNCRYKYTYFLDCQVILVIFRGFEQCPF
jgi:hypothetical protein